MFGNYGHFKGNLSFHEKLTVIRPLYKNGKNVSDFHNLHALTHRHDHKDNDYFRKITMHPGVENDAFWQKKFFFFGKKTSFKYDISTNLLLNYTTYIPIRIF